MPKVQKNRSKLHSKNNSKKYQKSQQQSAFFSIIKKVLLPTAAASLLFFIITFSSNIKAQVASIINEDSNGMVSITSLMSAVSNNDLQGAEFFSKSGAGIVNQKNIGGATALHIAARNGNTEITNILIKNGANVNLSDNEGWTPLMRASLAKNPELVKALLTAGADAKTINSMGETAIIHATASDCFECLEQLFVGYDFSANLDGFTLHNQIQSAITIAENKNNSQTQTILKSYKESLEIKNNTTNISAFDPVASHGSAPIVKTLGSFGNQKNKKSTYKFKGEKIHSEDHTDAPESEMQESMVTPVAPQAPNNNIKNIYNGGNNNEQITISTLSPTTGQRFIFKGFKNSSPFASKNNTTNPVFVSKTNFPPQSSIVLQNDISTNPKKFIFKGLRNSPPLQQNAKNNSNGNTGGGMVTRSGEGVSANFIQQINPSNAPSNALSNAALEQKLPTAQPFDNVHLSDNPSETNINNSDKVPSYNVNNSNVPTSKIQYKFMVKKVTDPVH